MCPVGALSLYLFTRWQVNNEPVPAFSKRENWFDVYLLRSSKKLKDKEVFGPLTYESQYSAVRTAFKV